ncbi:hypothetical protein J2S55_007695 [Streptosporangium brasiliense]|uniref:Uncharacterized protein n=1 Tax=Streptosporangium brasiliense TaxID=47480 RepID=A0ABT9RI83_9ACTN|nr:hypothetical protein [Streptosporangium brasiliense]
MDASPPARPIPLPTRLIELPDGGRDHGREEDA